MPFKEKGMGSKFCDCQSFGDCNGGNGSWLARLGNGALQLVVEGVDLILGIRDGLELVLLRRKSMLNRLDLARLDYRSLCSEEKNILKIK